MGIKTKHLILLARLIIGSLFIYASIYKVLNPGDFATSIRNYMLLPVGWTNVVAITLPWVELGSGIFLLLGILIRPSAFLTTTMLAGFLVGLVYAYWIGLDIDCGCFSSSAESTGKIGPYYLLRDLSLFLTSTFIVLFDQGDFSAVKKLRKIEASL